MVEELKEITTQEVRNFLKKIPGQKITLRELRSELGITPEMKSFDAVRNIMFQLAEQKEVRATGMKGEYKVIAEIKPIRVFGRERKNPIELFFPRDSDSGMEMLFAKDIIIREGDMILLSGMSNYGKTCLCLNFAAENLDNYPVLMGNEYTTIDNEPSQRFLNRLDNMDWVKWYNGNGEDRFLLMPVREDYAEHVMKDRLNIIDWINLPGEYYMISPVMEGIKREIGKGNAIIALQKNAGTDYGRGGYLTKDFADCELLLDQLGEGSEVLLTIGKVKEAKRKVMGRTFAYEVSQGVKIINFREVIKCPTCYGKKWKKVGNSSIPCTDCKKTGYIDR